LDPDEGAEPWARGWRVQVSGPGQCLYLVPTGQDPGPKVVFVSTVGGCAADAAWLQQALRPEIASVAYDRAGLGLSDPPLTADAGTATAELGWLIDRVAPEQPTVLVGLGYGGWVARELAVTRPDRVAGLVLVDVPPSLPDLGGAAARGLDRATATLRWTLARMGVSGAIAPLTSDPIGLAKAAAEERRMILASPQHHAGILREATEWSERADAVGTLDLPDRELPIAVVATTRTGSSAHAAQIVSAQRSRRGWMATVEGASLQDLLGPRRGQTTVDAICHVTMLVH
jgi:pimeloyl-ACP methyl ester carboxylesterase